MSTDPSIVDRPPPSTLNWASACGATPTSVSRAKPRTRRPTVLNFLLLNFLWVYIDYFSSNDCSPAGLECTSALPLPLTLRSRTTRQHRALHLVVEIPTSFTVRAP